MVEASLSENHNTKNESQHMWPIPSKQKYKHNTQNPKVCS